MTAVVVDPGEDELLAAAYLNRVAEPGSVALWLLVGELGYVDAADAVRDGGVSPEVASCTDARRLTADPRADLAAGDRNELRLLTPNSPDWPHFALGSMQRLAQRRVSEWKSGRRTRPSAGELIPPLALWVRGEGRLSDVGLRSIAVVGSRSASSYGDHIASDWAYGLSRHEVIVVSGGAYGIDSAAHRGALAADGPSVLVSACGLDRPYPAGHAALYSRTAERGVVVSEHPPGSAPHRQRFLSRNRLIAAFGAATLVVEAGHRSGALNTARHARDLGRPVLAVPGPVSSAMSVGCHRLLQRDEDPARLVTSVSEVLAYCGGSEAGSDTDSEDTLFPVQAKDPANAVYDALDYRGRAVLDGFPIAETVTAERLARLSGVAESVLRSLLPELIELGVVRSVADGYRLADPAATR